MCCFFKSAEEMYAQSSRLESGLEGLDISATEYFVNSVQGRASPPRGWGAPWLLPGSLRPSRPGPGAELACQVHIRRILTLLGHQLSLKGLRTASELGHCPIQGAETDPWVSGCLATDTGHGPGGSADPRCPLTCGKTST